MWHITSKSDHTRWVQYDQGVMTGDDQSIAAITAGAGQPVEYAPMAGDYTPTSAGDEAGLYLIARAVVPGPLVVTGIPPMVPEPVRDPGELDGGPLPAPV